MSHAHTSNAQVGRTNIVPGFWSNNGILCLGISIWRYHRSNWCSWPSILHTRHHHENSTYGLPKCPWFRLIRFRLWRSTMRPARDDTTTTRCKQSRMLIEAVSIEGCTTCRYPQGQINIRQPDREDQVRRTALPDPTGES